MVAGVLFYNSIPDAARQPAGINGGRPFIIKGNNETRLERP